MKGDRVKDQKKIKQMKEVLRKVKMSQEEEEEEGKCFVNKIALEKHSSELLSEERLAELLNKLLKIETQEVEKDEPDYSNLLTPEETRAFTEFVKS